MGEKIVFIAHSYHKKTLSYEFIVDELKKFYDVEVIFDERWETGKSIDWDSLDESLKAVVIFQMFPNEEDFKKIKNKNIIYLPMFDHVEKWHFSKWLICKDVKIISFSSTLHKKLINWGFNSMLVQFFIKPTENFIQGAEDEVFFWQRLTKMNINIVKKIFNNSDIKLHIHKVADPGQEFIPPTKEDEERFKITYSEWFDTKEELQELIESKAIYIAPRYTEGIGMSFLEALALGKVIIANNKPTMSEYIINGKTGYLCDFKHPKPIKLKNIREMQKNAYEYAKAGHEQWLRGKENIIKFVEAVPRKNKLKLWTRLCFPFLLFDVRKIIKFKLGKNPCLKLFGVMIIGKE